LDKLGKPILNLKKTNFVVYEDGVKQEIYDFAATTAPFEVALLLDTSGSTRNDLNLIQKSAESFIQSLRAGDKVSIIAFNSKVKDGKKVSVSEVLINLTDDRTRLKDALAKVTTSNGTPYYHGLSQVIETVFAEKPTEKFRGRRALVALTDGVDSASEIEFDDLKREFQRAGIVCYFIRVDTRLFFEETLLGDCEDEDTVRFSRSQIRRFYKVFYPSSKVEKEFNFCKIGDFERLDMSKRLYQLADSEMNYLAKVSSGKVFEVSLLREANTAFQKVAQEIGLKYSLGYYSSNEKRDGTYRKIRVEIKGLPAGTQIRAREGYTAPKN
jgi:Ca-activated chloride channel homolog